VDAPVDRLRPGGWRFPVVVREVWHYSRPKETPMSRSVGGEAVGAVRGSGWLGDFAQDLRQAIRQLTRERSFAPLAMIVLAFGIGANGLFLTLVEMICLRGLPIERPDRVMYVASRDGRPGGLSRPEFEALRASGRSFAGLAAFTAASMTIGEEGRAPDLVPGTFISASLRSETRVRPAIELVAGVGPCSRGSGCSRATPSTSSGSTIR
jgi:hypothetical protein